MTYGCNFARDFAQYGACHFIYSQESSAVRIFMCLDDFKNISDFKKDSQRYYMLASIIRNSFGIEKSIVLER